jgi:dynein heavy chain
MLLDDQIMKVQAMNASPFVKPFRTESTAWEATLMWLQVRRFEVLMWI